MALEASELAVRVKLLGGAAFKAEADSTAGSLDKIGMAGKKSGASVAAGSNKSHSMLTKMGGTASKVGGQMIGLGRTMSMAGIPIAAVGYYATKASSQFGQAMTLLSTQANMPIKSIKSVSAAVEKMAPAVGATPLALAQALYPIESIGLRGPKAMNALTAAAKGSAVGLDSLENTADAVTTVMASKIKGSGGPVEAMSIMDRSIGLGKMHLQDLTESFKSGIVPISKQFGLSFKQILAAASGLTRVGIPANQVMARMRLTLTSMIAPTTAGLKAMSTMGITQFQLADDLRKPGGLLTALQDIKTHADALGNKDQANALIASMFGKSRGMASIGSLLEQLPQIQGIYSKVMATTPQTLNTHFAQTQQTSAFKYKQIQANLDSAMIKLGDALNKVLLPLLTKLVPILTSVVTWFGKLSPGTQKFLVILMGAAVVGGPLLMFVGAIVKVGGLLLGAFSAAIEAVIGSSEGAGMMGLGGKILPLIGSFGGVGLAVAAFTGGLLWANSNIPFIHSGLMDLGNAIRGFLGMTTKPSHKGLINARNGKYVSPGLHPTKKNPTVRDLKGGGTGNLGMKGWHRDPHHPGVMIPGMTAAGKKHIGGLTPMEPGIRSPMPRLKGSNSVQAPDTFGSMREHMNGIEFKGQFTANTYLDGKQIATSTNQYNRKSQNRR